METTANKTPLPFGGGEGGEAVNHPQHYNSHPSGIECIDIVRHYCFDVGNVFKYLWRAGLKQSADKTPLQKELEDCRKALWYLEDHIRQLEKRTANDRPRT